MKSLRIAWCALIAHASFLGAASMAETESKCTSCNGLPNPMVFYVDGTFGLPRQAWTTHFNQPSRPVKTLHDAKMLIREFRTQCFEDGLSLDRNIQVQIREGTYVPDLDADNRPAPLRLDDPDLDGGTPSYSITWTAVWSNVLDDYESVLISGGIVLDQFTSNSPSEVDHWWTQKTPWSTTGWQDELVLRDLYVGNTRAIRAREPDIGEADTIEGFATVDGMDITIGSPGEMGMLKTSANKYTLVVDHEFPKSTVIPPPIRSYGSERGTECVLRWGGGWASHRQYVRDVRPDTMTGKTEIDLWDMIGVPGIPERESMYVYDHDPMKCGNVSEVYLENAWEFMNQPYEWWFNPMGGDTDPYANDRLWIILPDGVIPGNIQGETSTIEIVAPYAAELFILEDCTNVIIKNLNFAHTRQALPRPGNFDDLHGGQPVVIYQPSGTPQGNYEDFQILKRSQITPSLEDEVEYPYVGWFEAMRNNQFYVEKKGPVYSKYAHGAAIRSVRGDGVVVRNCRIAHLGGSGIVFADGGGSRDPSVDELVNTIESNEIFNVGASAVVLCRENRTTHFDLNGPQVTPQDFAVTDNYIYDIGKTYLASPGIHIGWTASGEGHTGLHADNGGKVLRNYIAQCPSDGIYMGHQPEDNNCQTLPGRQHNRNLEVEENVVRDAVLLMHDMASIVMMHDADNCDVRWNVVYQTTPHTGRAAYSRRGLYTDGKGYQFQGASGWTIEENLIWNITRQFHMNTRFTCPDDNMWLRNYVDDNPPIMPCNKCTVGDMESFMEGGCTFSTTECLLTPFWMPDPVVECANGFEVSRLHIQFGPVSGPGSERYTYDANLADPATRSGPATTLIGDAGPDSLLHSFLYTSFEPLIHPSGAMNRTPPAP